MEVPKEIKELLENPIFEGVDIKNLENAINKKFDKNPCDRVSLLAKYFDKCVFPLNKDDRNKLVNGILNDNDGKLPDGMKRKDIQDAIDYYNKFGAERLKEVERDDTSSITEAAKFMNTTFSPDNGDKECIDNCVKNITSMVDIIKEKTIKDAEEFQKFDFYLSDYYAASLVLHNTFYALLTYYKYKNNTTGVQFLEDTIKNMKYTDTTISSIGLYFTRRMRTLVKNYKKDITSFNYQFSIFSRDLPVTIIEIGISKAVRAKADKKLDDIIRDISNQIDFYDSQIEYKLNKHNAKDSIVGDIMGEYGVEPSEEEAKDPEYIKTKQDQLYSLLVSNEKKIRSRFIQLKDNAKKIGYNFYTSKKEEYSETFVDMVDAFIEKHNHMVSLLENTDIDNISNTIKKDMTQILCCGKPLEIDDTETKYKKDNNNKTYSEVNAESDISANEYWKEFTKYLNLIALLPIYWKIGLYIPTPAGILKVPLPIIFIHLITIKIGPIIIVIWLTINGLVIVPVVFTLQFLPIADAASVWLVLFRGANKKIKDKTGVEVLNIPIIGGININPELSKTLPFKKDDLPTIERLGITNPLYLVYLNQMLQKATPSMGLP